MRGQANERCDGCNYLKSLDVRLSPLAVIAIKFRCVSPEKKTRKGCFFKSEEKNWSGAYAGSLKGGNTMQKLPIGLSDFKKLRQKGYYFIDKSDSTF